MLLFYEEEGALSPRLDSRLRGNDGAGGVGSRFAVRAWRRGWLGDWALRAPSRRYRADWIPAYAGMTVIGVGSRFRGSDVGAWGD